MPEGNPEGPEVIIVCQMPVRSDGVVITPVPEVDNP